jgi:hypothetical protein
VILSDNQFIGKQQLHQGKGAYFWDSPEANLALAAKPEGKIYMSEENFRHT